MEKKPMLNKLLPLLLVLLVLGLPLPALAKEADHSHQGRVPPEVDYNGDGKVSLKEHLAWENAVFAESDLNGDGFITTAEVAQKQMDMLVKMRKARGESAEFSAEDLRPMQGSFSSAIDTDGDGKVSLQEHLAYETNNFRGNDLNSDGFITSQEITERKAQIAAEIRQQISVKRYQQDQGARRPPARNYQD
jgi:hypothetical protein